MRKCLAFWDGEHFFLCIFFTRSLGVGPQLNNKQPADCVGIVVVVIGNYCVVSGHVIAVGDARPDSATVGSASAGKQTNVSYSLLSLSVSVVWARAACSSVRC